MNLTLRKYAFAIVAAAAMLTTMLLWRSYCVEWADDLVYSHELGYEIADPVSYKVGPEIESFAQLWDSWHRHSQDLNGRLVNMLCFVMFLLSPWVMVAVCGLVSAVLPFLLLLAAGGRRIFQRRVFVASAMVLCFFVLPWYDQMQSVDFLMNYVFTSVAMLGAIAMRPGVNTMSRAKYALMLFLCVFAAWGHEQFGIALTAYMVVIAMHRRVKRREWVSIAVTVVALGVGMIAGTFGRVMRHGSGLVHVIYVDKLMLFEMRYCWLMLVALAAALIWRRKMMRGDWQKLLALAAGWLPSVLIVMNMTQFGRVMFCPVSLALVACYVVADRLLPWRRTIGGAIAAYVIMGFWAFFAVELISWQREVKRECDNARVALAATEGNVVFADVSTDKDIPWYTAHMPMGGRYCNITNQFCEPQLFGKPNGFVVVAPTAFENLPFEQWPKVPGRNPFRVVNGLFVADTLINSTVDARITFGNPTPSMTPVNRLVFKLYEVLGKEYPAADRVYFCYPVGEYQGRMLYVYIIWYENIMLNRGLEIKSIDLIAAENTQTFG